MTWSTRTGDTGRTANSVPRSSDPIAARTASWIVTQNAPRTSYLVRISITLGLLPPRRQLGEPRPTRDGSDGAARWASGTCVRSGRVSGPRLVARGAEVGVDGLLPRTVGDHRLHRV